MNANFIILTNNILFILFNETVHCKLNVITVEIVKRMDKLFSQFKM